MLCDLHTHTTASDGQYSPAELAGLAKARGLSVLAVTDRDTIAGVSALMRFCNFSPNKRCRKMASKRVQPLYN